MRKGLAGVLERQGQALVRHLRGARRGEARAVHQARVASRRLREALPAALGAGPDVGRLDCGGDVRRVTRALGAIREIQVTLREFDREAAARAWDPAGVARLREHLTAERGRRLRAARAKLNRLELKRVAGQVRALAEVCDGCDASAWRTRLSGRLRKRARRFAEALRAVGTLYVPEPLHRVRIAAKKLRYTLELVRAATRAPVGRDLAALRRLQDLLGHLRDLQVLQEHLRVVAARTDERAVSTALDDIHRELDAECRLLHAKFLVRIDRLLAVADRAGRLAPGLVGPRAVLRLTTPRRASARRATA
jgi:CHAD domain-containing protein